MPYKAIQWIHKNTLQDQGVLVTSSRNECYPEVTGYYIPTLLSIGEDRLAQQYARWLASIQKKDGRICAPGTDEGFAFDTGQVIRGWVSVLDRMPELEKPLLKACAWIIESADPVTGRLLVPDNSWELGHRGHLNEGVHLYCLSPLARAGELLGCNSFKRFAIKSRDYYIKNINLTDFSRTNAFSHFYSYIQEALIELDCADEAHKGMTSVLPFRDSEGLIPGYHDVTWTCSTGMAQMAKIWYMLGESRIANETFSALRNLQNKSGGFFGSYGINASYFPTEEIAWAVKYFVDAYQLHIADFFNQNAVIFSEVLDPSDGRLSAILKNVGNLNGKKVLDVGAGKGRYIRRLLATYPNAKFSALDISKEMLRHIPEGVDTTVGSLLDIPHPDKKFDVILCIETLEHAVQVREAIAEMTRVLAPDGKLLILDKNTDKLGTLEMPEWEQWFDKNNLLDVINKSGLKAYSFDVPPSNQEFPHGLFSCWIGTKMKKNVSIHTENNNETIQQKNFVDASLRKKNFQENKTAPYSCTKLREKKLLTNLSPKEWHNAIKGTRSPRDIAADIRQNITPKWLKPILQNTSPGDSFLELGSGTGELSAALSLQNRTANLLDFSQRSIDFAQKVFEALDINGNFQQLDMLTNFSHLYKDIDCVWSSGVLEHFSDKEIQHIVSESALIAKKVVIAMVPNASSIPYRLGKWFQEQNNQWQWGYEDPKYSLSNFFKNAGLQNIQEYSIASRHALNFMTFPGKEILCNIFEGYYDSMGDIELQRLNQGYLLVTVGDVPDNRNV